MEELEGDEMEAAAYMFKTGLFDGLTLSQWYDLFLGVVLCLIQQARVLVRHSRADAAVEILNQAFYSKVFSYSKKRKQITKFHQMGLFFIIEAAALAGEEYHSVCDVARWFMDAIPCLETYRLYNAVFGGGGPAAVSVYASNALTKLLSRKIKSGEALNPIALSLYGHCSLAGRSYNMALEQYFKAFKQAPNDPLINLCIGISLLHRAMNRTTPNRHIQITQGVSFIFRYFELRGKTSEAYYNVARGLFLEFM